MPAETSPSGATFHEKRGVPTFTGLKQREPHTHLMRQLTSLMLVVVRQNMYILSLIHI